MSLAIRKLVTRCHVARKRQSAAALVEGLARDRFGVELGHYLGPSLSSSSEVVRIRRLTVRVRIPAGQLAESTLLGAWLEAFGRALFEALAYPPGAGPVETVRAPSRARFLAMALADIADGGADRWQYAEFRDVLSVSDRHPLLAILEAEPAEILETFAELDSLGALELVLARCGELELERLFLAIARLLGAPETPLRAEHLVFAAKWARTHPPVHGFAFDSRHQALRVFVRARKTQGDVAGPRRILHALLALASLLESPDAPAWLAGTAHSPIAAGQDPGRWLPAEVVAFLRHPPGAKHTELHAALESVRALLPSACLPGATPEARWISSECAGVFLLASLLPRRDPGRFTLPGLALSAPERFDPELKSLDSAVALFAGFTGDPDLAAMRADFRTPGRAEELDRMAGELVLALGARIRGFRKAPRGAIVRQFLAHPGRVRVEPDRVLVQLAPSPFHIALHISGMDAAVESAPWLEGRRIEYHLEGL